jgi:release factor glutamine methyltransferase
VTYESLLKVAYQKAKAFDKEEEAVKLLLMEISKKDPHQFYMDLKQEVDPQIETYFLQCLHQYLYEDVPVQHLIGHAYFYGYAFHVNQDVLIPRAETEQLVEHVLFYYDQYFQGQPAQVLDLGTGSGCIGLTLSLEEKNMRVTVSDISSQALKVTTLNNEKLNANVDIIQSDLFKQIKGRFDIIVSNPPYIPDHEVVDKIVAKEPSVALYGGSLGIDFYEKIINDSVNFLSEKALLAFEHGFQQKDQIYHLARKTFPQASIIQRKDLSGKDRFTFIGTGGVLK